MPSSVKLRKMMFLFGDKAVGVVNALQSGARSAIRGRRTPFSQLRRVNNLGDADAAKSQKLDRRRPSGARLLSTMPQTESAKALRI